MERAGGERPVTVENGTGVVVIGDGNRIGLPEPAVARSGYHEQVRRIAPSELVDREGELAELEAFCRADSGPAYTWWRAEAWAGKTALLSWFALNPPPGVRIVPFFVTARLGAQNDVTAYVDVVLEQLAELAGEGPPALLTAATREAHLLRLYAAAAESCAARGERLVLLVDGLDEDRGVTTGPDARSIAALLPYGLPVIVSGRLNPPLPVDVPEDHPLRAPEAVRILAPSPRARTIRAEAERELKRLLEAGGLPYELLALLTAAGGGLTADDLAELTGGVPYRVKDVLRTGPGRTFAVRGEAYLLAHEELVAGAREMLGERELGRWRSVLHAWADRSREDGWPDGTPDYLLHGYVPMLRAAGDAERLVACAADERRHERLLAVTGADAAALAEIGAAEDVLLGATDREDSVTGALRLAWSRARLLRESGSVPLALLEGWAAVGSADRAVALARSFRGQRVVDGLCAVASKLLDVGAPERAMEIAVEAEEVIETLRDRPDRDVAMAQDEGDWTFAAADVVQLLVRLGAHGRARRLLTTISSAAARVAPRHTVVRGLLAAGRHEEAVALGGEGSGAGLRAEIVEALVRDGLVAEAEREAYRPEKEPGARAVVLLRAVVALREAGHPEAADAALREAMLERARMGPRKSDVFHAPLLHGLVAAGEIEAARQDCGDGGPAALAWALVANGRWDEFREFAGAMEGPGWSSVRVRAARELARAGAVEQAMAHAPSLDSPVRRDDPWPAIASALLERGDLNGVAALCGRLVESVASPWGGLVEETAWRRFGERPAGLGVFGDFLRRLVAEGAVDRVRAMAGGVEGNTEAVAVLAEVLYGTGCAAEARGLLAAEEMRLRRPPRETLAADLVALVPALVEAGRREDAAGLLRVVEEEPGLDPGGAVSAALAVRRVEWAEALAWGAARHQRVTLLPRVVAGYVADGAFDRALRLVGQPDVPKTLVLQAAVIFAEAAAWDQALDLAATLTEVPEVMETLARMASACLRQGRREEARRILDDLGEQRAPWGLEAVRAAYALGEGVRGMLAAGPLLRARRTGVTDLVMVVMGSHDEAIDFFRAQSPNPPGHQLVRLVNELLLAHRHERAAALLDGMHHMGQSCGEAYALLARAEPDPVPARRWAVLALRLGDWRTVLPAVLAVDPGSLPLVLAEADRLRRALEV
ncbi:MULTISPECIES: hypothetical protein [Streptomyces]|uniref:Uncharacterized protein n=1 Tax=Streptomyces venezuelae TaxID=54571 RepID=A0A5P2ARX0_STRVZ|nr:hypothetical protein [Streptomyces venezuelae]QES20318.1 hypothetical protein DEJ46_15350 [Streptomyces venezuelae]